LFPAASKLVQLLVMLKNNNGPVQIKLDYTNTLRPAA
jgi:hypothetical protein